MNHIRAIAFFGQGRLTKARFSEYQFLGLLGGPPLQSLRPATEVPNARHWKQPKNSRKGCRVGHGKTAEKQPEKHPKHPKNSRNSCFSGVSGVFPAVFRLVYRDPLGTLFGCFSAVFNVGHLATSVAGRRDCKPTSAILTHSKACVNKKQTVSSSVFK